MPIVKITGQGLFAIGLSVALLWGCLIGERVLLHHASSRRMRVLHQIHELQHQPRPTPATAPAPRAARPMITVG
ncbi:MAG TPA: hypothetical protein VHW09_05205 [Bryobacteraceae bacterium]|jgi:hypothetical protein|nr:hypothetical protein [Bryobacteraceae bacterium]